MMKNCELAEFGSCERAIPTEPRSNGSRENSAGRLGSFDPPVPLVAGLDVAGLGHEAVDHAVEDDVVVVALLGQGLDLLDVLRREVRLERGW